MRSIKRLPGTVHSSLRSSVYLFDFTRVVEELIFNSVDAGSTKVLVSIDIGEFYVKVEDDGCGITREGLLLLEDKCASSKLQNLADSNDNVESLSYRGETLGSLSDVSFLEIITKTRGRPNGYHKIMKDWKCLYLGIDDQRKDAGTTVIVRDLFYNQPVRRKSIRTSPKKVLYSVKKSILRIALIYPQLSLQLIDIEKDLNLLCTVPALSPMPLILTAFGNDKAAALRELNFSDGVYRLSGYISKPEVSTSSKGFQYLYINSRYICKGPIHRLIDSLFADYQVLRNCWSEEPEFQKRKRNKILCHASYLLNLVCPLTLYGLIFEPTKTVAQFKDWIPVLFFISQAVNNSWKQDSFPDPLDAGLLEHDKDIKQTQCKAACSNQTVFPSHFFGFNTNDNTCSSSGQKVTSFCPVGSKFLSEELLYGGSSIAEKVNYLTLERKAASHLHRDENVHYLTDSLVDYDACDTECTNISKFTACANVPENSEFECDSSGFDPDTSELFSNLVGYRPESRDITDIYAFEGYNPKTWLLTPDIHQKKVLGFSGPFMMRKCQTQSKLEFLANDIISLYNKNAYSLEENEFDVGSPFKNYKTDTFHQSNDSEWLVKCQWSPTGNIQNRSNCSKEKYGPCTKSIFHRAISPDPFSLDEVGGILDCDDSGYLSHSAENMSQSRYSFDEPDSSELNIDANCLESQSLIKLKNESTCWLESPYPVEQKNDFTDNHLLVKCQQSFPVKMKHRSQSAPPFHKCKSKFTSLHDYISTISQRDTNTLLGSRILQDSSDLCKEISQLADILGPHSEKIVSACSNHYSMNNHDNEIKQSHHSSLCCVSSIDDKSFEKIKQDDFGSNFTKWRSTNPETTILDKSFKSPNDKHDILSISSGLLNLAGSFVGSESISRDSLEGAKVLLQLDKKFIPIVANGTLCIIDQHAADERIRLEELRRKVLSGEGITVSYLESEQELVLPEVGVQLMHTYAERIKKWGWMCSLQVDRSKSFSKNLTTLKRRPDNIALIAVPCILGVNLSYKDLIEYLEQLSETDGSSTVPPSVTRLLNLKACRGAIMFGDALLPSECSLLVDELKKTSLCFQCAHGRPTTVPIINMAELHQQLAKLGQHHGGCQTEEWHGLHQHIPSIQRAQSRLNSAMRRLGHT